MNFVKNWLIVIIVLCSMPNLRAMDNQFMKGFEKGIGSLTPNQSFNVLAWLSWWSAPSAGLALQGFKNMYDQVLQPESDARGHEKNNNSVKSSMMFTGYAVGNALKILLYAAPALVRDLARLRVCVEGPCGNELPPTAVKNFEKTLQATIGAIIVPIIIRMFQAR